MNWIANIVARSFTTIVDYLAEGYEAYDRKFYQHFKFALPRYTVLLIFVPILLNYAGFKFWFWEWGPFGYSFWLGLKQINGFLGVVLFITSVLVILRPSILAESIGFAVIADFKQPILGTKNELLLLAKIVSTFLLYLSFFFLVVGSVQFGRNFFGIGIIVLGIIVACLMFFIWSIKYTFVRTIMYFITGGVLVVYILYAIPGPSWLNILGDDPFLNSQYNETSKEIWKAQDADANITDNKGSKIVKETREFMKEKSLTFNDLKKNYPAKWTAYDNELKRVKKNSFSNKAKGVSSSLVGTVGSFFDDIEKTEYYIREKIDDNHYKITFLTDEPIVLFDAWRKGKSILFTGPKNGGLLYKDPELAGLLDEFPIGVKIDIHQNSALVFKYKKGGKLDYYL